MSADLPKSPGDIEPSKPTEPVGSEETEGRGTPFEEFMQDGGPSRASNSQAANPQQVPSPMDLAKSGAPQNGHPTMESVRSQMATTSSALGDLQNKLNTPKLKLKPSAKYLLRNKLSEANNKIRDAAKKSGVDVGDPVENMGRNNPVMKFLGLVTDGMKQLNAAQNHIALLSKGGTSLRPAELLLVQSKLSRAQQEIEYSSTLLASAINDMKMLFNTQI